MVVVVVVPEPETPWVVAIPAALALGLRPRAANISLR